MISQVRGLSIWRKGETYKDVGGSDSIKDFLAKIMRGAEPPRVLVLLDEFEKMMAGSSSQAGDSSGTKQEMHGMLLSEMEDMDYAGLILFGAPGCSKTLIVKATGGEFNTPVIVMSIADMLEKFVGSSNENLRAALNIIRATSQGRAFLLATCNTMVNLSGPLRRRFSFGQWMFDLPTQQERAMIWPIHRKRYGLKEQDLPPDEGWTGAEIRNCCKMAYQMNVPLQEAAEFIVPVSRTMAEEIEKMRQSANGRFKSASYPGFYQLNRPAAATTPAGGKRAIAVEG
jgi:hypothetical protein